MNSTGINNEKGVIAPVSNNFCQNSAVDYALRHEWFSDTAPLTKKWTGNLAGNLDTISLVDATDYGLNFGWTDSNIVIVIFLLFVH